MTDAETKNDALVRRHSASLTLTPGEASEQRYLADWTKKKRVRHNESALRCQKTSASEITDLADQKTITTISQNKEILTRSKSERSASHNFG